MPLYLFRKCKRWRLQVPYYVHASVLDLGDMPIKLFLFSEAGKNHLRMQNRLDAGLLPGRGSITPCYKHILPIPWFNLGNVPNLPTHRIIANKATLVK